MPYDRTVSNRDRRALTRAAKRERIGDAIGRAVDVAISGSYHLALINEDPIALAILDIEQHAAIADPWRHRHRRSRRHGSSY
jgi:hypothetical protein